MNFVYVKGGPQGQHEQEIANKGWKWMRTNTIDATRLPHYVYSGKPSDYTNPDRLGKHSHHGRSTHLVVKGDLCIQKHHGDRDKYELSEYGKRQDLVNPDMPYSATSRQGCTFVEGHEALSPRSAERFITRGTLRLDRKHGAAWEYPSDEDLKRWLTSVEFNPKGKAHPKKGEVPILDDSNVDPPIPEEFLTAFSEWLENEWRRPSWWEQFLGSLVLLLFVVWGLYWILSPFVQIYSRM